MPLRDPKLETNFTHIFITPSVEFDESNTKVPKFTVESNARKQPGIKLFDELDVNDPQQKFRDWISYFAQQYKEAVRDAILHQEFKNKPVPQRYGGGPWAPLNEDYARWKQKNELPGANDIWIRSGQLHDAIRVRFLPQIGPQGAWIVGIDKTETFDEVVTTGRGWSLGRDTGKPILWIARMMEFGTSQMPPRPLFRPIADRLTKSVRTHFEDWKQIEGLD